MRSERTPPNQAAHDVLAAEEFVVPAADPRLHHPQAHDVLAAEEFVVPAPDSRLHHPHAHDVLAAEEFVVPARDPGLHHGPVLLPDDPTGIAEAHDVLAAEEFALPAPPPGAAEAHSRAHGSLRRGTTVLTSAGLALLITRRLRRRRA
jgi:hypothetical protein